MRRMRSQRPGHQPICVKSTPRAFALGVPCYSFICARSGRTKGTSPCLGKPYWPYHNRPPASGPNRPAGALARKMYPPVTALAGDAPRQPPLGKGAIALVSVQAQNTPRTLPSGFLKAFPAHGEGGATAPDEVPATRIPAQLRKNTPRTLPSGCRKAFPAHGEGGPLAVDEVPI